MKLIVGIDFGTSTTVVRYRTKGENGENGKDVTIQSLKTGSHSDIIPTVMFRHEDMACTSYGEQALADRDGGTPGEFIANFKIGLLDSVKEEEARKNIIDFLTYVHSLFEKQTKSVYYDTMDVYISYPAKWTPKMATFMKLAVEKAGFNGDGVTVKAMTEPQAASYNMLHEYKQQLIQNKLLKPGNPLRIMMLDMGAGTSDISIFKLEIDHDGETKISELLSYPSISEPVLCGGCEIDHAFQKYLSDWLTSKIPSLPSGCISLPCVKEWKEDTLSVKLKSAGKVEHQFPGEIAGALNFMGQAKILRSFSIDRQQFEEYTQEHWKKLYGLMRSAFAQYKFAKPEDIDCVFLTGGHSNWYVVPKLFNGEGLLSGLAQAGKDPEALNFKKIIEAPKLRMTDLNSTLPHECVARGLCLADEHVEIEAYPANNVWTKIIVCGIDGELTQVVSKGDILPQTRHVEFNKTISRNLIFGNLKFKVHIDVMTGETIEDAEKSQWEYCFDENSAIGKLLATIITLGIILFCKVNWQVSVLMDITMTEAGQLKVDGICKLDDKEQKFTEKDLKML